MVVPDTCRPQASESGPIIALLHEGIDEVPVLRLSFVEAENRGADITIVQCVAPHAKRADVDHFSELYFVQSELLTAAHPGVGSVEHARGLEFSKEVVDSLRGASMIVTTRDPVAGAPANWGKTAVHELLGTATCPVVIVPPGCSSPTHTSDRHSRDDRELMMSVMTHEPDVAHRAIVVGLIDEHHVGALDYALQRALLEQCRVRVVRPDEAGALVSPALCRLRRETHCVLIEVDSDGDVVRASGTSNEVNEFDQLLVLTPGSRGDMTVGIDGSASGWQHWTGLSPTPTSDRLGAWLRATCQKVARR